MTSRIPLFGLPHKCDVIRQGEVDDGGGGVEEGNLSPNVYSDRVCRFTLLDAEEEQVGFGAATGHRWKVLMEHSVNLQEHDRLRVTWGRYPNNKALLGVQDGFPPEVEITTPGGAKTLNWDIAEQEYVDSADDYRLLWTGLVWRFEDDIAPLTNDFTGHEQHHNIMNLAWSTEVGAGYSVTGQTGVSQDYTVLKAQDGIDYLGGEHHTTVICELQDVDE